MDSATPTFARSAFDASPRTPLPHHARTPKSIVEFFTDSPLNPGFASNLDDLIERHEPALRIHGHMHSDIDVHLGTTRVRCNRAGYEPEKNMRRGYDPELRVEID